MVVQMRIVSKMMGFAGEREVRHLTINKPFYSAHMLVGRKGKLTN